MRKAEMMTCPMPGPKKGVTIKQATGRPRSTGRNVSVSTPEAIARLGDNAKPAKKRSAHRPASDDVGTRAAPTVKSKPKGVPSNRIG